MNLSALDLKIELSPSQLLQIDEWLENFYSKCKSRMSDPIVEDSFLKISSTDIYNFLAVIDLSKENIFDFARLKRSSIQQLTTISKRKREPLVVNHYSSILELLQ